MGPDFPQPADIDAPEMERLQKARKDRSYKALRARQSTTLESVRRLLFVAAVLADEGLGQTERINQALDALSVALQVELHSYADCELKRVDLVSSVLARSKFTFSKRRGRDAPGNLLSPAVRARIAEQAQLLRDDFGTAKAARGLSSETDTPSSSSQQPRGTQRGTTPGTSRRQGTPGKTRRQSSPSASPQSRRAQGSPTKTRAASNSTKRQSGDPPEARAARAANANAKN